MSNRLALETSPYLRQHADNPVDWYAWNPESLQMALDQDKPILLSIGYSACHWCHVMAHESFEDEEVAAVMNANFINIKVDREERPDLDQIYQTAHFMLTHRNGGWPLTLFLCPDGTPFFGGTYFPKQARYNLPAFPDLLERVAQVYAEKRKEIAQQGQDLIAALAVSLPKPSGSEIALNDTPIELAVRQHIGNFDSINGGFGGAPKFLHPAELDLLLRYGKATGNERALHVVNYTLQQMALGGLYDQLGGGFCRYSVDERWDIPHFEKMLYDNGLLLALYCDAWQCSADPLFANVVEQTAGWVLREMNINGGYCSSLDADSEHEEGKFYVWQRNEIRALLSAEEYAIVKLYYGLDSTPNFDNHVWNLRVSSPLMEIAKRLQLSSEQATAMLDSAQKKLFDARERRVRPGRDDKILGAWNGLMISGMARAARVLNRAEWLLSAQNAMDFVRDTLWRDGKLLATFKDGKAHLNAYLDDHAFLLAASLELLQAEYRRVDLDFAIQLADALLERFEDKQGGGFFFTSHDHEVLILRNKIGQDNATPSGNGIAAAALLRLSALTGVAKYGVAAERSLKLFFPAMQQGASYHSSLCTALAEQLRPSSSLVLRGTTDGTAAWKAALHAHYLPDIITVIAFENAADLPDFLDKPQGEITTAWLCKAGRCLPPITSLDKLLEQLLLP